MTARPSREFSADLVRQLRADARRMDLPAEPDLVARVLAALPRDGSAPQVATPTEPPRRSLRWVLPGVGLAAGLGAALLFRPAPAPPAAEPPTIQTAATPAPPWSVPAMDLPALVLSPMDQELADVAADLRGTLAVVANALPGPTIEVP